MPLRCPPAAEQSSVLTLGFLISQPSIPSSFLSLSLSLFLWVRDGEGAPVIILHRNGRRRGAVTSHFWMDADLPPPFEGVNPKIEIEREEWEQMLKNVTIRKEDMDNLVMNFLMTEAYVEAAQKFQSESGAELDTDLVKMADRMSVMKAVQSGNAEDAIAKVNDLNSEILVTNPHLYFHLQQQRFIELVRHQKIQEALKFAQKELAPLGEENRSLLEELERTVALLVFDDAKTCPNGDLMEMSHRSETVSEVNAAILISQDHEKDPKLTNLLKMLIWAQNEIDAMAAYPHINDLHTAALEDPAL